MKIKKYENILGGGENDMNDMKRCILYRRTLTALAKIGLNLVCYTKMNKEPFFSVINNVQAIICELLWETHD